jgi:peptide/nickel transport system permease protein
VLRYVARRTLAALPLALGAATLVFVLMEAAPGDPADLLVGPGPVPPEVRERVERVYGLDRPAHERYLSWLGDLFLRGDLGWSHSRSRPVAEALVDALPPTITLATAALAIHLLAGIALGLFSAAWRGRWRDRWVTGGSLLLYAMPTFWLALMAILALSYKVPLFPASSIQSVGAEDWPLFARILDRLRHLALPAGVLGLSSAAATARFVRSGVLQSLELEFSRAARARGVGPRGLLWRHAFRNALIPVINLVGLSFPALLSGSLVIEVVFAWPGLGRLTYDAIRAGDVPVVLATTLFSTLVVVAGNLAADIAMAAADPRIRLLREGAAA